MNRPIKFRAWDLITKKMYYSVGMSLYGVIIYKDNENFPEQRIRERGKNCFELMLDTGLKDKNDKEIYEGDIIDEGLYIGWCDKCKQYQVFNCLNDCMSCSGDIPWCEFLSDISNTEILGNIYENKDLIKNI